MSLPVIIGSILLTEHSFELSPNTYLHVIMAGAPLFDVRRWHIYSLLNIPGAQVFTFVLKCGTKFSSTQPVPFDRYLVTLTAQSTANYVRMKSKEKKKLFNPDELRQIQKYPLWDNFDLSLLHKAIRVGCEHTASLDDNITWNNPQEMEGLLTIIKDERNSILHEREHLTEPAYRAKVTELERLFDECL